MTLADIKNYIFKRTKTNSTSFPAADMVIAINVAYHRVNSIIKKYVDNYHPTEFSASDLSTGTLSPIFDIDYHEILALWIVYNYDTDAGSRAQILQEIVMKEAELRKFYGVRNYSVFTTTIASPALLTKPNHGLITGQRISFITTGALPTGLSVDTFYWVVSAGMTDDVFEVSATRNGTAINTSGTQSGTHYFFTDVAKRIIPVSQDNR